MGEGFVTTSEIFIPYVVREALKNYHWENDQDRHGRIGQMSRSSEQGDNEEISLMVKVRLDKALPRQH